MAADAEFAPDALQDLLRRGRLAHPALKNRLARPLRAGSDQNDDAAAAHGMAGVGERLLCLVKIHILGRAAL